MLPIALGLAAALFAVVAILLFAAGRARARALGDDVRAHIEPYLRRKAAEAGLPADAPVWTRRSSPEEMVAYSARIGSRLLNLERSWPAGPPGGKDLALAQTQPVDTGRTTTPLPDPTETGRTTNKIER